MSFPRRRTLQEFGIDSAHSGWYVIFHPFIKERAAPFPTLVCFSFRKKGLRSLWIVLGNFTLKMWTRCQGDDIRFLFFCRWIKIDTNGKQLRWQHFKYFNDSVFKRWPQLGARPQSCFNPDRVNCGYRWTSRQLHRTLRFHLLQETKIQRYKLLCHIIGSLWYINYRTGDVVSLGRDHHRPSMDTRRVHV